MSKSIELDCPPGSPRPDDLIESVLEGTGLEVKDPVLKFFGCFTWIYDMPDEEWSKVQSIIKPRIQALYQRGTIRYGSW